MGRAECVCVWGGGGGIASQRRAKNVPEYFRVDVFSTTYVTMGNKSHMLPRSMPMSPFKQILIYIVTVETGKLNAAVHSRNFLSVSFVHFHALSSFVS